MNKRMFELIQRQNGESGLLWTEEDKERFAEQIVQECASFVSGAAEVHTQAEQDACARASRGLKNYFGIKE